MNGRQDFATPPAPASPNAVLGSTDRVARWLIQHAARSAPSSLSERLAEEWLADLEARSGRMARLRFGVGCCWATRVIALEHCAPKVPATSSVTGSKIMAAYAQHDYSFLSRRTTAFVLIVCLHAVLIYALATGFGHAMIAVIAQPFQAVFLPEQRTRVEPPPPLVSTQPKFSTPTVEIHRTEFKLDVAPETIVVRDVVPWTDEIPTPPSTPPKAVNRAVGGPGKAFPNTDDYYPPVAVRLGETGIATVRTCVDDKGRLTAAPTLAQSSGSASIDEGALKLAKAGSGHYRATTEDGRPVSSCYEFRIKFDLRDLRR
jgi:protein TonB